MRDRLVHLARSPAAACLAPCALLAAGMFLSWTFTVDDLYISLRHAHNLVAHGVLSFETGQRVEAYSNFLHVMIAAGIMELGFDPVLVLKAIGAACALACVPATYALARRLGAEHGFATFGALLLSLNAGLFFWATSGLETALATLLLTAGVLLFLPERRELDLAASALFVALSLTRVEGPVYVAALGVHRVASQARRGLGPGRIAAANAPWCALFAVLYGGYFLWRLDYFGHLFPTSIHFKRAPGVAVVGETHTVSFLRSSWPFLVAAAGALLARPRPVAACLAPVAAATAAFLGSRTDVLEDVSTMAYLDRYFVPVLPCLFAAAALGLQWARRRVELRPPLRASLAAFAAGLVVWQIVNPYTSLLRTLPRIVAYPPAVKARNLPTAVYLEGRFGADGRVLAGDVGLLGYYFTGTVDDLFGLASYESARFGGRMREYAALLLRREPDAIVLCRDENDEPCHESERQLAELPGFRARYAETRRFGRALFPQAHYVVYERRDTLAGGGGDATSGGGDAPRDRARGPGGAPRG